MKTIILLIFLFFSFGCATTRHVPVARQVTWKEKKRECHAYYLNMFGFSMSDAITICKEELEKN